MAEDNEHRKIKLIWDFHGPNAERTAEHHALHLTEYIKSNNISLNITGFEPVRQGYCMAFMVVEEEEMKKVREALKPHRGQVYKE